MQRPHGYGSEGIEIAIAAAKIWPAAPSLAKATEGSIGAARPRGIGGDTLVQVGLALLCVVLSALSWLPLLDGFGPVG